MMVLLLGTGGCANNAHLPDEPSHYVQCDTSTGLCEKPSSGNNPIQIWSNPGYRDLRGSLGRFSGSWDLPKLLTQHGSALELTGSEAFLFEEKEILPKEKEAFLFKRFIHGKRLPGHARVHLDRQEVTSITGIVSAKYVRPPSTFTISQTRALQIASERMRRFGKRDGKEADFVGSPELLYCSGEDKNYDWSLCWYLYAKFNGELLQEIIINAISGESFEVIREITITGQ